MPNAILESLADGLVSLSWWGYLTLAAVTIHVTVIGVTHYYHRDQAHRALDLHPSVASLVRA
jgi:stearoyl-CoA desaturase (delta-9 desaturase)